MLIHPAVNLPALIKGCYITQIDQFFMHVSACCNLHFELILARHLTIRSTEWLVDHSLHPVCQYACCLVLNLNHAAGKTPHICVTLLQCGRMLKSGHGVIYSVLKNIYCDCTGIFFYLTACMTTSLRSFCMTASISALATIPIFCKLGSAHFSSE
jgi:hypothetical protein